MKRDLNTSRNLLTSVTSESSFCNKLQNILKIQIGSWGGLERSQYSCKFCSFHSNTASSAVAMEQFQKRERTQLNFKGSGRELRTTHSINETIILSYLALTLWLAILRWWGRNHLFVAWKNNSMIHMRVYRDRRSVYTQAWSYIHSFCKEFQLCFTLYFQTTSCK